MRKNKLIDYLIISFVFIAVASFPFNLIFYSELAIILCKIGFQALFLAFTIIFGFKRSNLFYSHSKINIKNIIILLPTLILTVSNYFPLLYEGYDHTISLNSIFYLNIVLTLLSVINEELIFRLFLIENLNVEATSLKVLLSAIIFGMMHFLNGFSFQTVIQVGYTTFLGLVLGIIFVMSGSVIPCIVFHFLFNTLNQNLYSFVYPGVINQSIYFVSNILVGCVVFVYLVMVLLIKFLIKKHKLKCFR